MQIPIIKNMVEQFSIDELEQAEQALLNEEPLPSAIEGNDEGEQLTHIIASIWILEEMEKRDIPFPKALRAYTEKVRNSIS